jgi:asparagine synthase (glutamine-hydrolysing)
MNDAQSHRGPDDVGLWVGRLADGAFVGLGSRRLSILDLSPAGRMPMSTPDGRFTITYNGEVYNYPSLRRDLESRGYRFRSGSDTEAVLYLFQEYREESVRLLNGMFAFAIWDDLEKELFLARDHFGVKPLYYCLQPGRLAFASEIKALFELPEMPHCINLPALNQFLTFLWVPDPLTLFDGILKLPAAHWARYRDGELETKRYWDYTFPPSDYAFSTYEPAVADELRERLAASVKTQLLSDVPLGSFLSAGLDSSSIVALMHETAGEPVRTYTVGFPEKDRRGETTLDDTEVARRTAERFGCEHREIIVEADVVSLLPKLVYHMDEPVADPAIIAAHVVARAASRDVKVLLSGVGGDELFAGYRKHAGFKLTRKYQLLPRFLRKKVVEPLAVAMPSMRGTPAKGYMRLAKKAFRSGSLEPREYFLTNGTYLNDNDRAALLRPEVRSELEGDQPWSGLLGHFDEVNDADFLNQMLYVDAKAFMVSLNLNYNDKMSMAASVEVRVPFLDWELAEWVAWNVAPEFKLRNGTTKHILREAMRPLLPAEVLEQKKAGFGAPVDAWLAGDLCEMVDELLGESTIRRRGLFDPAAVEKLIAEQRRGKQDRSLQVWQLLTLELWSRAFLD